MVDGKENYKFDLGVKVNHDPFSLSTEMKYSGVDKTEKYLYALLGGNFGTLRHGK